MDKESFDHPKDPFPKNSAKDQLIAPDYVKKEGDRILEELRKARPSGLDRLGDNSRISVAGNSRITEYGAGSISRGQTQPAFPSTPSTTQVSQTANITANIAFFLSDAGTTGGSPTKRVKVHDGKINGQFPSGMGFDNYILSLSDPSDSIIYAGITFNPVTLAITSRFLGVSTASGFPISRIDNATSGFLYWQIGFTFLNAQNLFKIENTRPGNIDFAFAYGDFNGVPSLLPIDSQPNWISAAALFP